MTKPDLKQSIVTPRFELRPLGRWGTIRQARILEADADIRMSLFHRKEPLSLARLMLHSKRQKIPQRLNQAIVVRETGTVIGFHSIHLIKHNTATMVVVVHDKDWWGAGVVVEVRKALIPAYQAATGVAQFACDVHSRNFASILNHKKLGFERVGVNYSAAYDHVNDCPADYFTFSLRGDALMKRIEAWTRDAQ